MTLPRLGTRKLFVAGLLTLMLCSQSVAARADDEADRVRDARPRALQKAIRESIPLLTKDRPGMAATGRRAQGSYGRITKSMNASTRGALIAAGVVGGIYAGAYIGATLEGDCRCDDPGLQGALIGIPIGGFLGGLGMAFLTR
jgi:hypothetical protein